MLSEAIAAFLVGFLGSGHCMSMCGGIASLLSNNARSLSPSIPLYYNLGRLTSYALFGVLIGGSVATIAEFSHINQMFVWLRIASAVFMIVLALYLGRWWLGLLKLEQLGQGIWKRISPFSRRLLPLKKPIYAIPLGFLWGWLPCGLIYSMLTWAAVSGSGVNGGLIMASFGLGTCPSILAISYSVTFVKHIQRAASIRYLAALLLLVYATTILVESINMLRQS